MLPFQRATSTGAFSTGPSCLSSPSLCTSGKGNSLLCAHQVGKTLLSSCSSLSQSPYSWEPCWCILLLTALPPSHAHTGHSFRGQKAKEDGELEGPAPNSPCVGLKQGCWLVLGTGSSPKGDGGPQLLGGSSVKAHTAVLLFKDPHGGS